MNTGLSCCRKEHVPFRFFPLHISGSCPKHQNWQQPSRNKKAAKCFGLQEENANFGSFKNAFKGSENKLNIILVQLM
jgi:hypothetical protein